MAQSVDDLIAEGELAPETSVSAWWWLLPAGLVGAAAGIFAFAAAKKKPAASPPKEDSPPTLRSAPSSSDSPAPALLKLLKQINEAYPSRNKASDGIMASAAHKAASAAAGRKDDHAVGDALDITRDEKNGPDLTALRDALIQDPRVTYIILDKKIISRVLQPFVLRDYNGPNPHTHHIHISIDDSKRNDTGDWNLKVASA